MKPESAAPAKPKQTAKSLEQALLDRAPWRPPHAELVDIVAIQALANGVADRDQQKIALDWIIQKAAGTYDYAYRPGDNDRDTNIALGRQHVGQSIVKLIRTNVAKLRGGNHEQG